MKLSFKIDRQMLQDLLAMPESSMITHLKVTDNGFIEFKVQDIAIPEVPGVLEVRPVMIDGVWSWNLAEAIH